MEGFNATILIVDDNVSLNDALRDVLEMRFPDFTIDQAFDGESAISYSQTHIPDIVIEDIMLPDMNGLDVVRNIKEIDSDIQVIIMTAFASVDTAIGAIQQGAYDFLPKPFHNDQLIKAVESALRKRLTLLENRTLISKLLHANQKMKTIKDYYRKYFQISSSVEVDFSTPMILSLYDFKLKKVMFDQILSITLHICDTDKGYCMVILPHGEIEIISSTNTDYPEGKRLDLDSVEEGIKQSIKRKEVLRSEDMKRLYVPMGVGGDIFGVIVIDRDKRFFSEDVELMSAIMVGASAAIELNLLKEKFYDINTQSLILLLNIAGLRDVELQRHLQRVSSIAGGFARFLGMSEKEVQDIEYAGLLHDIGKMGIGEDILNKKGPLNEEEREKIEQHTKIGVDVLSSLTMLDRLMPIIYHHHERYDGSGYPDGLKGEEIPLGARIIAIVDAFDAITSKRPYREPLNEKDGLEEMKKFRGKIFDPDLLDKFEEYINKIMLKGGKNEISKNQ